MTDVSRTLPAVHAGHLVELVRRWNVGADELLGPVGLDPASIEDPHARVSLETIAALIDRARRLTGEPGIGIYLGKAMRISWHGYLGFAAMTAETIRDALEVASRFIPTRTTALALRLHEDEREAAVIVEEREPLGTARDALVLALLVGIAELGSALTGESLAGRVELALPEPPYFARFRPLFRGPVKFDQPQHRIVFDRALLSLPLKQADAAAQQLAMEQCERELAALGFADRASSRVRALLQRSGDALPSQDELARELAMSVRTLKRKLTAEGTSFTELVDEERRDRALALLASPTLSIEQIADRLGYADASAFTRAFTRWTGKTPGAVRKDAVPKGRAPQR